MAIGIILQAIAVIAIGTYTVFFNKFSKKLHIFICICLLIPTIFVSFLAIYGNRGTATFDEDVIIVLGAGTNVANAASPLARRWDTAIYYFERNPNAYVVVCGGLGVRATITEAEAMARHLHERGIPLERILLEDLSTSTLENLTFAQEILNEHFPEGFRAVVVSNDFHMFRTVSIARRIGMDVNHLGASTPVHLLTENYLREMLAVINFWIS
ncbi:MAG: YdcF family protein [Defluviitaleaceae bacterium]|nr:YdcF family protein [Defluviitaleaceae bacterium]